MKMKKSENGPWYTYGDISAATIQEIIQYSPYISLTEYNKIRHRAKLATGLCIFPSILSTTATVVGAVLSFSPRVSANNPKASQIGTPLMIFGGLASGTFYATIISANVRWNRYVKQSFENHNKQVDENIKKYGIKDQASVSVNVGATPTGIGVSLSF